MVLFVFLIQNILHNSYQVRVQSLKAKKMKSLFVSKRRIEKYFTPDFEPTLFAKSSFAFFSSLLFLQSCYNRLFRKYAEKLSNIKFIFYRANILVIKFYFSLFNVIKHYQAFNPDSLKTNFQFSEILYYF